MPLNEDTWRFIREHRNDDVRTLALRAKNYTNVELTTALTQIAGWQQTCDKVPTWAHTEGIIYPPHLSLEQCSSEVTAQYKAGLLKNSPAESLTDLTGGFGIDCSFLSQHFKHATYVERQEILCEAARTNFPLLRLNHIKVCQDDSLNYLRNMNPCDWIFIDPARRDGHGGKTIAIADCEPNVAELEDLLLSKAPQVLIKLSPMLDLTLAINTLHHVTEAHIVSVNNDCKELLLILKRDAAVNPDDVPIHCINLLPHKATTQTLTFSRNQEKYATAQYTNEVKKYLYEPNVSVMKGGAFCMLCEQYPLEKLHPNSHLYTSQVYLPDFPGRKFEISGCASLNKKEVKSLLGGISKANLTVRNFPASVADLRKRLKLTEGGNLYLFATTLNNDQKVLIAGKSESDFSPKMA